jgi:hypothetical protein
VTGKLLPCFETMLIFNDSLCVLESEIIDYIYTVYYVLERVPFLVVPSSARGFCHGARQCRGWEIVQEVQRLKRNLIWHFGIHFGFRIEIP